jgi:two-component system response regulator AtoC
VTRPAAQRGVRAASPPRVLVVDDAEGIRAYLSSLLEIRGYEVECAAEGGRALTLLDAGATPDAILLDVMLPEPGGLEILRAIRERDAEVPVVMLSVVGRASTIVEAMRLGATDYLNKPFDEDELERALEGALAARAPTRPGGGRSADTSREAGLLDTPTLGRIREVLARIADTDVAVLIQGESGTGKEIVARAVHAISTRRAGPFVKVNCAALPGELLESELFGYERGAFTGAHQRKTGRFEAASGGTIFLDEIAEMSPALQAKLLHVLQDGTFSRLGGNREQRADARVVTATHRPLDRLVAEAGFREDLFFRLNVVNLMVPPLRERREEIPALIEHFLRRFTVRYGKPPLTLSSRLMKLLARHDFPGNVRQLENLVKRIVILGSEEPVLRELQETERGGPRRSQLAELFAEVERTAGSLPLREVGRRAALEAERETIDQVLLRTNWNRKRAARILGVSYKTLLQKIRECGLEP